MRTEIEHSALAAAATGDLLAGDDPPTAPLAAPNEVTIGELIPT